MIAQKLENVSPFTDFLEVADSYLKDDIQGNEAIEKAAKVIVFGLLQEGGHLYIQVIPNAKGKTLLPVMEAQYGLGSFI